MSIASLSSVTCTTELFRRNSTFRPTFAGSSRHGSAAPIHGAPDVGTAAINVSAHASRVSMVAMRGQILPILLDTARQIEADLHAQSSR